MNLSGVYICSSNLLRSIIKQNNKKSKLTGTKPYKITNTKDSFKIISKNSKICSFLTTFINQTSIIFPKKGDKFSFIPFNISKLFAGSDLI
jgi:predicted ribosome-associated RNA-binding protein Tma20